MKQSFLLLATTLFVSTAHAEIPEAFQGHWGTRESCKNLSFYGAAEPTITTGGVGGGEWGCTLKKTLSSGPSMFVGRFACNGDGYESARTEKISLKLIGEKLSYNGAQPVSRCKESYKNKPAATEQIDVKVESSDFKIKAFQSLVGKPYWAMLKNKEVSSALRQALGRDYSKFALRTEAGGNIVRDGRLISGGGIMAHMGGMDESAMVFDLASGKLYVALRVDGKAKLYGAGSTAELPAYVKEKFLENAFNF